MLHRRFRKGCGRMCNIYLVVIFKYYGYIRERYPRFYFSNSWKSKRPDAESTFRYLSSGATNITMEVVEKNIRLLIAKSKVVNSKTKQGLHSFFIADCQLKPEIEISDLKNTLSCLQKGTSNETVGISGETPSLVGCNIQGFATRLVAIKAFFMNAIFELKQEIESFPRDKEILG